MKSIFKNSIIVAALLFGVASVSHAQVKIGTAPETIDPNSNLEVQAANGNKTIVNKATGQVTIQDGTQGAGKVLVSDANGASSWQAGVPSAPNSEVVVSARLTIAQPLSSVLTKVNFDVKPFDKNNNFDLASDQLTAPSSGYYLVNVTFTRGSAENNWYVAYIYVNDADSGEGTLWAEEVGAGNGWDTSGMRMIHLNAGDKLDIRFKAGGPSSMAKASVQIAKISN